MAQCRAGLEWGTPASRDDCRRALDDTLLERRGLIRWLRPEFQNPSGQQGADQGELETAAAAAEVAPASKRAWPKDIPTQVKELVAVLAAAPAPLSTDELAAHFRGRGPKQRVPQLVEMLVAIGRARRVNDDGIIVAS